MKTRMWLCALAVIGAVGLAAPAPVWSMAGSSDSAAADPKEAEYYKAGEAAIKAWKWAEAVDWLKKTVERNAKNANAHNYLGYAYRHLKNYDDALKHYKLALKISPEHKGAHEYIGEAYLLLNNPAKAREHLAALDQICLFGCEEFDELKAAVAAYEEKQKKSS